MIVIIVYAAILVALVLLGIIFYLRAAVSRRLVVCPHCGEQLQIELMGATTCTVCGASLEQGDLR